MEIAGRPILEWTLDAVRAAGIRDVLVVRGYRGDTLTGPFETVDNPDWERSNMVVSLLAADRWIVDPEGNRIELWQPAPGS